MCLLWGPLRHSKSSHGRSPYLLEDVGLRRNQSHKHCRKTKNPAEKLNGKCKDQKFLLAVNTLFLMPKGQACKLRGPPCPTHTKFACTSGGWGRKAAIPRRNWRVAWKFETWHSQERQDAATTDISAACADATLFPQQQWAPGSPPERWGLAPMAS